jgi:hypothetical protein
LLFFQLKKARESDPDPVSWGAFEHRYSTQKRMPKMVMTSSFVGSNAIFLSELKQNHLSIP